MEFEKLTEIPNDVLSKQDINEPSFYLDSERETENELQYNDSQIINECFFSHELGIYVDSDRECLEGPQWSECYYKLDNSSCGNQDLEELNYDEKEYNMKDENFEKDIDIEHFWNNEEKEDLDEQNLEKQNFEKLDDEKKQSDESSEVADNKSICDSSDCNENDEKDDLSEDEINEKQKAAVSSKLGA